MSATGAPTQPPVRLEEAHWAGEREARLDAFRWLHRYNVRRRYSRLGHRSPIAYENAFRTTSTTLTQTA